MNKQKRLLLFDLDGNFSPVEDLLFGGFPKEYIMKCDSLTNLKKIATNKKMQKNLEIPVVIYELDIPYFEQNPFIFNEIKSSRNKIREIYSPEEFYVTDLKIIDISKIKTLADIGAIDFPDSGNLLPRNFDANEHDFYKIFGKNLLKTIFSSKE